MQDANLNPTQPVAADGPDLVTIKARQQGSWASGDYAVVGTTLQIVGERLCEALDLRSGQTVLDVAAGNGNASLAAARRWCRVTSTDYVPALLDKGKQRAEAEGLRIAFEPADAEALPYADGRFDVVLSTFGVMFTPNQEKAANEMLRVCRPGGRIGLANWTPNSFVGNVFKLIGRFVPPPDGLRPPSLWGTQARIEELFAHAANITAEAQNFVFRYQSPEHWIDVFRNWYGPVHKAFAALPEEKQDDLHRELVNLIDRFNEADDGTVVVPSDYLEVVMVKH